ncbi:MAG: hypothetical protein INF43_05950 [Alphaproteobacteria bacterium]|nr:hypothetical protein [Alphaproteobacteria bacterium]
MHSKPAPKREDFANFYEQILDSINHGLSVQHGYSKILISFNLATILLIVSSISLINKNIIYYILFIPILYLLYSSHNLFKGMISISALSIKFSTNFKAILFRMKNFHDYSFDIFEEEVEKSCLKPFEDTDKLHNENFKKCNEYTITAVILIFIFMMMIKIYEI